ncbi:flagellar hook-associated protein FlgL [Lysobacter sp. GX 14042]|uniref:flagellar hook-associated protein FlgL n=1 Tax=Lysobacter sp. GX 14042 TaxID=2907155 RepID=UPI001F415516|nr:flagellar hook-associated protein FlgL [Lysobacter sp. GX 14042]MCE7031962.1 flagellar hook-associated protein FlgL [Lysobacter sp. GX 14042]
MRISTAGMYLQGLQAMMQRQSELARTSEQISSGMRFSRAGQDPAAATAAQQLDHALASLGQFKGNAGHAQRRLEMQETALSDAGDQLGRARDLVVRANTPTLSDQDRRLIAVEMREIRSQLLDIANRQDGAGRALFAGTRDGVVPFTDGAGNVSYAGNDGRNDIEVAPGLSVADTDPGSALFMRMPTGDGIVRASAGDANTGSGVLKQASVTDHRSWNGEGITAEFTAPDQYRVLDAGGAEIASGSWESGQAISAGGVQMQLSGAPAAGDSFSLEPSGTRDIFATLDGIADLLETPGGNPAADARRANILSGALGDLGSAQEHLLAARASTGARLSTLDNAAESRESTALALESTLSGLRDTDYAEAATRLGMQLNALEAAQQVTLRIQGLSLFNKL